MVQLLKEIITELKKLNVHIEKIEQLFQPKTLEFKANITGEVNPARIASALKKLPICLQ